MKANRLVHETSPYLRQHAHNPVDWYPWGEEALQRARQQDRPILLSVGYSACHWCHVMEHESFENEAIARMMNEHFVNIKVDREERPDLDEVYMTAVQAMTGQGGWPMTVFLTPDLRPFYGGTYFPPEDRYGRAGFPRVLQAVVQYFRDHRDQVEEKAQELMRALEESVTFLVPGEEPDEELLENAFQQLRQRYDSAHGGFGGAPKFPPSMSLGLLLRYHRRQGNPQALEMVEHTLKRMARGGLCDQLGGGFHRYSVDERWLVPHFEKMLYDNALLVWVYLEAYQATSGERFYGEVVRRVLDYALREMMHPEGGFCASQDADSEGEEGRYFTWLPEEVEALLGEEEARLFMRYYQVTPEGNFEHGRSILHVENEMEGLARFLKVEEQRLREVVERGQKVLFQARQKRVPPGRDDKLIVAWNGLMISACARAHQALGEDAYLQAAQKSAGFILEHLVEEGNLLHTYKDGRAQLRAYQDDYACLINGLLDLYEADLDRKWLEEAERLNGEMMARFWDEEQGGFFYAEKGAADLIVRTKNPFDNATPSGNSMGALVLLRLAAWRGDEALRQRAAQTLRLFQPLMRRVPSGSAQMLCALDFYLEGAWEIALVGTRAEQRAFARAVYGRFVPNKVVAGAEPGQGGAELEARWPLLAGRVQEGKGARAYLCRDFSCSPPLRSAAELGAELDAQAHGKR